MLTFKAFTGINNVQPPERLSDSALVRATDVDIGLTGELSRRAGFSEASDLCHKNLHQADGFMLATVDGGDLVSILPGGARTVLLDSLGADRVWYCNLPDGRVAFSNGLIHGMARQNSSTSWSVPAPESVGMLAVTSGGLHKGRYAYYLTHVRASDGLEGPPTMAAPAEVEGGILLMGLPQLEGHSTNVYLSGANGEGAYLAGNTAATDFMFGGSNTQLTLPCRTMGLSAAPVGTVMAFWRGRVLVAQGGTLWASMPHAPHLFDLRRDFKQMGSRITLVQPVDSGVYVGTDQDLFYLGGEQFDALVLQAKSLGPVVLGSGVKAPGASIKLGDGVGSGTAMLCIAGGHVVAGFNGGQAHAMTDGVYRTAAAEVAATFREMDGIPQYLAVPQ